jgi:capsule polysaccharide export protein KpsE/RkpR
LARFGTGAAGRQRRFISEQLEKTQKDLAAAEDALRHCQERNRAVSIGDQAREASAEAGRLKGEIIASEIQLKLLGGFATDSNPEVIKVKNRIGELKRQLSRAQYSAGMDLPPAPGNSGHTQKEIYLPPARAPQIGLELARLTRDVKVQETVYTFLTQQLEQARLAEAQDMPVVQVLDEAVPASHRSKPRIKKNMALAGGVSLFFGVFLVFSLEYIAKQKRHDSVSQTLVSG